MMAQQVFLVMTVGDGEVTCLDETTYVFSSFDKARAWAEKNCSAYLITSRVVDHPETTTEARQ